MADGKSKITTSVGQFTPIRIYGKFKGFKYQGEITLTGVGKSVLCIDLWCKDKPKGELIEVLSVLLPKKSMPAVIDRGSQVSTTESFLEQALKKLASNKLSIDKKTSQIRMSVCPTMALDMQNSPDYRREIYADRQLLELYSSAVVNRYEQGGNDMNNSGAAPAPEKARESEKEKEERNRQKDARHKRELKNLQNLTHEQIKAIGETLHLLANTESTAVVELFKFAAAVRSRELALKNNEAEMSFESRANTWYEVWRHPLYKNKIYESFTGLIKQFPGIFQDNLFNLSRRAKDFKDIKAHSTKRSKTAGNSE